MNMDGVKPLFEDTSAPRELRSFVALARNGGPTQADLDRLAARLAPMVGLSAGLLASGSAVLGTPPVGVASALQPAAAKVGALGKLLASAGGKWLAAGLSLGLGAGIWTLASREPEAQPVMARAPVVVTPAPSEAPAPSAAPATPQVALAPAVRSAPAARARVPAAAKVALAEPVLAPAAPAPSELSLIQQAEAARSHSAEALAILARHEQLYPRGALAQEREVLAVEMLLKAGNATQASARAQRFEAVNPGSAHLSRLRALLERAPGE